ncbi:MAG: hypothetical protein OEM59_06240 [Rhodospirillales bacterium]|nr:hypothetical protein [Rhodospirillales bacterium]
MKGSSPLLIVVLAVATFFAAMQFRRILDVDSCFDRSGVRNERYDICEGIKKI